MNKNLKKKLHEPLVSDHFPVYYQFSEAVAVVAYDRFISYDLLDASVMSFLPTLEIKGDLDVVGELCTKYYPFLISQENI